MKEIRDAVIHIIHESDIREGVNKNQVMLQDVLGSLKPYLESDMVIFVADDGAETILKSRWSRGVETVKRSHVKDLIRIFEEYMEISKKEFDEYVSGYMISRGIYQTKYYEDGVRLREQIEELKKLLNF